MPTDQDHEFRVRFNETLHPDSVTEPTSDPKLAGETYRHVRQLIDAAGRGGEASIEKRRCGPWTTEETSVIEARPQ